MPWAVAGAAISAYGAYSAADKGSDAARRAGNDANAASELNYQRALDNYSPYMNAGTGALTGLTALANGDYSGFLQAPDYLATQQSGLQSLDRSAAARGALNSGGADADRIAFGANLGAQQLGNYRGSLMSLAQMGQNAVAGVSNAANGVATTAGNVAYNTADASSSASAAQNGAISGFLSSLMGQFGGTKNNAGASAYTPPANYGAFTPNTGAGYGTLGPSNGSTWNFGGGGW